MSTEEQAHLGLRNSQAAAREVTLDRVELRGIAGFGYHGVLDFERERGQRFVADVSCFMDLSVPAKSDDLSDTVDYSALAQAIHADLERDPVNLIEALADRIARTCLETPRVHAVQVTVHKPQAPIPLDFSDVAVTLTRSRN